MSHSFAQFWGNAPVRASFLSNFEQDDLASLRLACRNFSSVVAPVLFERVSVTFRSATFTRQSRIAALQRVGHHVKSFHFRMLHSSETFLPPLIDSNTGETVNFIYEPYTCPHKDSETRQSQPCYGDWELTDLLIRQYPPLFHAAANVPSFIRAFASLCNLQHLSISCPSQEPILQGRRSIVDYALISLRIAMESNRMPKFKSLSLIDVHPEATLYLNPVMGFGALPNSPRRWRQVRNLRLQIRSSEATCTQKDYLKHAHAYLQIFSPSVRKLDFSWLGRRDTCSIVLSTSTSGHLPRMSPMAEGQTSRPLKFARLRDLKVGNTTAEARQIARFIVAHHRAVRHTKRLKLRFNDTRLSHGTWDEALEPLTDMSGSDSWKSSSEESCEEPVEEFMDVPIVFSIMEERDEELNKVWNDHVTSRSSRPHYSSLQRAGARTKELLFGTEEHMRNFFNTAVFGWR